MRRKIAEIGEKSKGRPKTHKNVFCGAPIPNQRNTLTFENFKHHQSHFKSSEKGGVYRPDADSWKRQSHSCSRRDLLGCAQTGTGKTAGLRRSCPSALMGETEPERKKTVKAWF